MVSVKEAPGLQYSIVDGEKKFYGNLFNETEVEKATVIANALAGMTITEANELLDKIKHYLGMSIFCPDGR